MNNDKRIILAIAIYAAVMTMILHSFGAEAHEKDLVHSGNVVNDYHQSPRLSREIMQNYFQDLKVPSRAQERECLPKILLYRILLEKYTDKES